MSLEKQGIATFLAQSLILFVKQGGMYDSQLRDNSNCDGVDEYF